MRDDDAKWEESKRQFLAEYEKICRKHQMRIGAEGGLVVIGTRSERGAESDIDRTIEKLKKRNIWVI